VRAFEKLQRAVKSAAVPRKPEENGQGAST
jgi:hypothetical protein